MRKERLTEREAIVGSEYSVFNKILRVVWRLVWLLLVYPSPRFMHGWRRFIYRCFGAKLGYGARIYATAEVWAPWNLECGRMVAVADGVEIYNPVMVVLNDEVIISQNAYICCAEHNPDKFGFPLVLGVIVVGPRAWIAARSIVLPGVHVGEGAVLAVGALASQDLHPWTIYGGVPARKIRGRHKDDPSCSF